METIRTLGLYQPYAQLMFHGKIETRWIRQGTKPPFPLGEYLLYSCKQEYPVQTVSQMAGEKQFKRIKELTHGATLLKGHALMLGTLKKIIYVVPGMENETFVMYQGPQQYVNKRGNIVTRVRVGLIFENIRAIKPFPFKGKQGVGILSDQDRAKIKLFGVGEPCMI